MVLVRGLFLMEDRISLLRGLLDLLLFFFLDPFMTEEALLITLLVALVATVPIAALARGMRKDMSAYTMGKDIVGGDGEGKVEGDRSDQEPFVSNDGARRRKRCTHQVDA